MEFSFNELIYLLNEDWENKKINLKLLLAIFFYHNTILYIMYNAKEMKT